MYFSFLFFCLCHQGRMCAVQAPEDKANRMYAPRAGAGEPQQTPTDPHNGSSLLQSPAWACLVRAIDQQLMAGADAVEVGVPALHAEGVPLAAVEQDDHAGRLGEVGDVLDREERQAGWLQGRVVVPDALHGER